MDKFLSNNENTKNKEIKAEDSLRMTVSRAADSALLSVVERVNDGFTGGRVNRSQIANWILVRFGESLSEPEIKAIRADHYDAVAALECALRRAKETGSVPDDLRLLLQKNEGLDDSPKKARPRLTKTFINDENKNNEGTTN